MSSSAPQRDKQREIVSINCGGCGVNVGCDLLEQFTADAGISIFGEKECKTAYDSSIGIMFEEQSNHKFVSRSLFIDTDPSSINNIRRRYNYRSLVPSKNLISGKEDCAFNYAKAFYHAGKEISNSVDEQLRTLAESCDNIQGFLLNHSMGGGTGSGFTARIIEKLGIDYPKKSMFINSVLFPEEGLTGSPSLQIYNAMLYADASLSRIRNLIDVIIDNTAIHEMCQIHLKLKNPRFAHYNRFIAKLVGDLTASSRFGINETLNSVVVDMAPFPRLHFLAASMYPMLPRNAANVSLSPQEMADWCVSPKLFSVYLPDFDVEEDKHMATSFAIRGDGISQDLSTSYATMTWLQNNRKMRWLEWVPEKPMLKLVNKAKAKQLPNDDMLVTGKQCSMLMNNTAIGRVFTEKIAKRFDVLYSQRAYVHHYVGQGLQKGELLEAREDLGFLEKDYLDVLTEPATDDYDDEDESY